MRSLQFLLATSSFLFLAACGGSDGGAPAPPSGLAAEPLTGGAHLTWTDNADNETEFMVMRMDGLVDAEYQTIATVPFDTEQYHDAPLTSGIAYMYKVMAMNDEGDSESREIRFDAP